MTRTVVNNSYLPSVGNASYYVTLQAVSTVGGAALVLNRQTTASGSNGGIVSTPYWEYLLAIANNDVANTVVYTVIGLDLNGVVNTETVSVGPAGSANTVNFYQTVLSITTNTTTTGTTVGLTGLGHSAPFYMSPGQINKQWALQLTTDTPTSDTITFNVEITNYPIKNMTVNPVVYTQVFGNATNTTSVWTPVPYYPLGVSASALTYGTGSALTKGTATVTIISSDIVAYAARVNVTSLSGGHRLLSLAWTEQGDL